MVSFKKQAPDPHSVLAEHPEPNKNRVPLGAVPAGVRPTHLPMTGQNALFSGCKAERRRAKEPVSGGPEMLRGEELDGEVSQSNCHV